MNKKTIGNKTYDIEESSNNTNIIYEEPIEVAAKANLIKSFETLDKQKEDSDCPSADELDLSGTGHDGVNSTLMAEKNLVELAGRFDHLKSLKKKTSRNTKRIISTPLDGGADFKDTLNGTVSAVESKNNPKMVQIQSE